jgi:hypothetical protein
MLPERWAARNRSDRRADLVGVVVLSAAIPVQHLARTVRALGVSLHDRMPASTVRAVQLGDLIVYPAICPARYGTVTDVRTLRPIKGATVELAGKRFVARSMAGIG